MLAGTGLSFDLPAASSKGVFASEGVLASAGDAPVEGLDGGGKETSGSDGRDFVNGAGW